MELDQKLYRQWVDINGDGLDDFLYIRVEGIYPKWTLRLNTGKGLGARIFIDKQRRR